MPDTQTAPLPVFDSAEWEAERLVYQAAREAVLQQNKTVLFDALAAAGVASVLVEFDGYGDSGQIENIDAVSGTTSVAPPAAEIDVGSVSWEQPEPRFERQSIVAALETLAYQLLHDTHLGWENCEGAYGDFAFDVAARTITLDYAERRTEIDPHLHTF